MESMQLCPCCAAHLAIEPGFTTMRCNNCDAPLVYANKGGVSGLLLLPDPRRVPYSDGRLSSVAFKTLDGASLAADCWRAASNVIARRRFFWGVGVAGFGGVALMFVGFAIAAFQAVISADRVALESATAVFLTSLAGIPISGFVAAFFWDGFLALSHQLRDNQRHTRRV